MDDGTLPVQVVGYYRGPAFRHEEVAEEFAEAAHRNGQELLAAGWHA